MLAIEMNVKVVDAAMVGVGAAFVFDNAFAVFESMHEMMFEKEGQGAEDARLIQGFQSLFQFGKRYGTLLRHKLLPYQNPVGGGLHPVRR